MIAAATGASDRSSHSEPQSLPTRAIRGALLDYADPAVTEGRYHQKGDPGLWYASFRERGAWAELFRHHESPEISPFEVRRHTILDNLGRVRASCSWSPRVLGPGCLVLDVSLPGLNGLELQKRIAAECMDMPIIFITGYCDVPMTVRAMKAGAGEFSPRPPRCGVHPFNR